jgi:hypothetical protein
VRAVINLIETPAGERPLRTPVDPPTDGATLRVINQTTDKIQSDLLHAFGMESRLSV